MADAQGRLLVIIPTRSRWADADGDSGGFSRESGRTLGWATHPTLQIKSAFRDTTSFPATKEVIKYPHIHQCKYVAEPLRDQYIRLRGRGDTGRVVVHQDNRYRVVF